MLYKGNNKFKTLHKGNELVTRVYKGDELVYQDIDALYSFKFTINTKKKANGTETDTNKTFTLSFYDYQQNNPSVPFTPVYVDWGDGTNDTIIDSGGTASITHTYSEAGTYQIKLLPTVFDNGYPREGWLSGLTFDTTYSYKIVSIDKALPEGSFVMSLQKTDRNNMAFRNTNRPISFNGLYNLAYIPADFYGNAIFRAGDISKSSMQSVFQNCCRYCGGSINLQDKTYNIMSVMKVLIDKIDTTGIEDFSTAFNGSFRETNSETIPSGLFDALDTTSAKNMSGMFSQTFWAVAPKSATATIPSGLFDSIDTSSATNVSQMFNQTFQRAFSDGELATTGSTVATIPDRLLPLNYPNATTASSLFNGTFHSAMVVSTAASIPEHIFDGLNIPLAKDLSSLFSGTFAAMSRSNVGIPNNLFSNVTLNQNANIFRSMFESTFYRIGFFYSVTPPPASTNSIPSGLFDFVNTSSGTDFSSMFRGTFCDYMPYSTAATIPSGLFDFLDMTNATSVADMFRQTFDDYGRNSTVATIPTGLFANLNTSNATSFTEMFMRTFSSYGSESTVLTIPGTLFSSLDMSNCKFATYMFESTFSSVGKKNPSITIPANLFSTLDLSIATQVSSLFNATFYGFGTANTSGTIPAGLFANISSPNATLMASMFYATFASTFEESTQITIPSDIFSALDMTKATSIKNMFMQTFSNFGRRSPSLTIPSNLFANVNFSRATDFSEVFRQTFENSFYAGPSGGTNPVVVPATLFQNVDTTTATTTKYMFLDTFHGAAIAAVPQGIFGHIKVPATHDRMFGECFGATERSYTKYGYQAATPLNDPFDGMTDFSWASASDTTNTSALYAMFRSYYTGTPDLNRIYNQPSLTGSASTVLQHFNFTPNVDLDTFMNQKFLTDWSTLPNNWK